jgi:hypothetical protein
MRKLDKHEFDFVVFISQNAVQKIRIMSCNGRGGLLAVHQRGKSPCSTNMLICSRTRSTVIWKRKEKNHQVKFRCKNPKKNNKDDKQPKENRLIEWWENVQHMNNSPGGAHRQNQSIQSQSHRLQKECY